MSSKTPTTKACTRQEMAARYGVHRNTLLRWLRRHHIILRPGLILPEDQQRIIAALGEPAYPPKMSDAEQEGLASRH